MFHFLAACGSICSHPCSKPSLRQLLDSPILQHCPEKALRYMHHHTDTPGLSSVDQANLTTCAPASLQILEQQSLLCLGKFQKESGPIAKVSLQKEMLVRASEP